MIYLMRKTTLFLILFFTTLISNAQIIPFEDEKTGKWGYKNEKTNEIVINAQYKVAIPFDNEEAAIVQPENTDKLHLIDKKGNKISALYININSFKNGLALVSDNDKKFKTKYGYINTKGKVVIPMIYDGADDFSEGLAYVYKGKSDYEGVTHNALGGFINTKGKVIIPLTYTYCYKPFSEGIVCVAKGKGTKKRWGAIDKTGKTIIPFTFKFVLEPFKNGISNTFSDTDYKHYFINKSGKAINKEKYSRIHDADNNGFIIVQNGDFSSQDPDGKDVRYGLVNNKGIPVTKVDYNYFKPSDKEFITGIKNEKAELLDKTGKVFLANKYNDLAILDKNVIAACQDGKCGVIDFYENIIIPFEYESIPYSMYPMYYNEDIFLVYKNGKYGFIDDTGKAITEIKYDSAETFQNGEALVQEGFNYYYINTSGKLSRYKQ